MGERREVDINLQQLKDVIETHLRSISVIDDNEDVTMNIYADGRCIEDDEVTLDLNVTPMLRTRRPRKDDE